MRAGVSPLVVGDMSLYELFSTAAALNESGKLAKPDVDEADWESAMEEMQKLAAVDSSLNLG